MRVLAIDAALTGCSVAMVEGGVVISHRVHPDARGATSALSAMVADVLAEAGGFAGVAVTVGPGSFTGLRAALSLAHGLALGAGVPVTGVTTGEALRDAAGPGAGLLADRVLWIATDTKRGRVVIESDAARWVTDIADIALPAAPVRILGDAARAVAQALAARGADACADDTQAVDAAHVGHVGARRLAGLLPALAALPIYAEPPEARLPANSRAAPA